MTRILALPVAIALLPLASVAEPLPLIPLPVKIERADGSFPFGVAPALNGLGNPFSLLPAVIRSAPPETKMH